MSTTAEGGRTALPNLARQFDLMAKGCRAHGLGSWEDHFFRLYEEARDGKISADEIAETIDYDYRNDSDGKAAANQIVTALLADADKSAQVKALEPFAKACEAAAWPTFESDNTPIDTSFGLTVGDLRRARAALSSAKGEGL